MNKWFRYIGIVLFSALLGAGAYAQQNCQNIPSLSTDFENGWEGWTGAITADVPNGPTGWINGWQDCPYKYQFGQPTWSVMRWNNGGGANSAWCLKGPGGYSNSSTSAVLDMTCPISASYIEATLTSPQIDLSAICDPALPPPVLTFDFSYTEFFTTANSPGMYIEVTPDINDANPAWYVAENFPSLSTLSHTVESDLQVGYDVVQNTCSFTQMPQPNSGQWVTVSVKLPAIVQTSKHAAVRFRIYAQPFNDALIGGTVLSGISPVYIDNINMSGYFNQDIAASKIGNLADSAVIQPQTQFTPIMRVRQVGNVLYNGSGATCTYQVYPLGNPSALVYNQSKLLTTAFTAQCTETPDIAFSLTKPLVTQAPGEYICQAIVSDSGWDCNPYNDTLRNDLVVGFDYDVKPLYFLSPVNERIADIVSLPQTPEVVVRNIGLNDVSGFRVDCWVYPPNNGAPLHLGPQIAGYVPSGKITTMTFANFTPSIAGTYTLKCVTELGSDENRHNDTLIETRQYYYRYDVKADSIIVPRNVLSGAPEIPQGGTYRPVCRFENNGAEFVGNVPIIFQAWKYPIVAGNKPEFVSMDTIQALNVQDGMRLFLFNSNPGWKKLWTPKQSGQYELVMFSNLYSLQFPDEDDQDPSNDTVKLIVSSIPPLLGTYQVGFGRDIPTLQAADDSLNYRGVGGNVTFQLMDNNFALSNDLHFYAPIRGAGPNARITFAPGPNLTPSITLSNGARIMMSGDADYIGFNGSNKTSGAPNRALTIVQTYSGTPAFYVTLGSSFDEVHNCVIKTPIVSGATAQKAQQPTIGIWQKNFYPIAGHDTSSCNNNVYDNNDIEGFRTGIWLQGLAPVFVAGPGLYEYRSDSNCVVKNNYIANGARAGVLGTNQYGIAVYGNEITNFYNSSTNSCGAMADEDAKTVGIGLGGVRTRCDQPFDHVAGPISPNLDSAKGYVVNARVYNNKIHDITADTNGAFGAVGIEVVQDTVWANALNAPSSPYTPGIHPTLTHNVVWNNMIWNINAGNAKGDARGILWDARDLNDMTLNTANKYFTTNDSIINNTIWMSGNTTGKVIDIDLGHAQKAMIWNNIIVNDAIASAKYMFSVAVQDPIKGNLNADRNLYWFGATNAGNNVLINEEILDPNGKYLTARTYATLQSWQAGSLNDEHSLFGNPEFISMVYPVNLNISTTIWSPAWQSGANLASSVVQTDINGNVRGLGGTPYDIGADEFQGLRYSSDLSAVELVSPISSGGTIITSNPINVQATVKNVGTTVQLQRKMFVVAMQVDTPGVGNETVVYEDTLLVNFNIGEIKGLTFGYNQTWGSFNAQSGKKYHIIVATEPDNNISNDTVQTYQKFFIRQNTVVVSYNGAATHGMADYDSVAMALNTLGVKFDAIDRSAFARSEDLTYAAWPTLIYCVENGTGTHPDNSMYTYALSYDERQEIKNFLNLGNANLRRSLIMAGMNVASLHDQTSGDEAAVDTDLTRDYLHIGYIGTPTSANYQNQITGVRIEPTIQERINALPGDVINALRPNTVKNGVAEYAYYYNVHTNLPARVDTAAGVTFWGQAGVVNYNTIFYGFDWRHLSRLANDNSSGITRVMLNSLSFILLHQGLVVPVELASFNAQRDGHDVEVTWTTASEKGVTQFNVQRKPANTFDWTAVDNGSVAAKGTPAVGADYNVRDYSLAPGVYDYRLAEVYSDGHVEYSNTKEVVMPGEYALYQNYPNPFNTSTTNIEYQLQDAGNVTLVLYDVLGNVVRTLVHGMVGAGDHIYSLDATALPAGTYYYRIQVNGFTQVRQMMLMK